MTNPWNIGSDTRNMQLRFTWHFLCTLYHSKKRLGGFNQKFVILVVSGKMYRVSWLRIPVLPRAVVSGGEVHCKKGGVVLTQFGYRFF